MYKKIANILAIFVHITCCLHILV